MKGYRSAQRVRFPGAISSTVLSKARWSMTGDEARAIRRGLKWSASALAAKVGATESSIYRWEQRGDQGTVPLMFEKALLQVLREENDRLRRRDSAVG